MSATNVRARHQNKCAKDFAPLFHVVHRKGSNRILTFLLVIQIIFTRTIFTAERDISKTTKFEAKQEKKENI